MNARHIVAMFVLVAIGLPVASARAALPKPKSKTIVVGKSIGAVKVGAKVATIKGKWGSNRACGASTVSFSCEYRGRRSQGAATVVHLGGRIRSVRITAGFGSANVPVFTSPLTKLKTAKGIGLGSTEADLRAAYPAAYNTAADVLTLGTPGKVRTFFAIVGGRVAEISIAR